MLLTNTFFDPSKLPLIHTWPNIKRADFCDLAKQVQMDDFRTRKRLSKFEADLFACCKAVNLAPKLGGLFGVIENITPHIIVPEASLILVIDSHVHKVTLEQSEQDRQVDAELDKMGFKQYRVVKNMIKRKPWNVTIYEFHQLGLIRMKKLMEKGVQKLT